MILFYGTPKGFGRLNKCDEDVGCRNRWVPFSKTRYFPVGLACTALKMCIIGSMSQREISKVIITVLGFAAFGWSWLYVMGAAALFLVIMAIKKKLKRNA